jgi:zinc/manganese transport system ATP-binding protein/zinc transport system ATP-binding protein
MRGTPLVTLTNVAAGYQRAPVIDNVDLTIMAGDFVGVVGPSGSGKTTLLRAVLGAVSIYEGTIDVGGRPPGHAKARVGYVPQLETVDWHFPVTVEEVVMMGLAARSGPLPWSSSEHRAAAADVMSRLGIAGLRRRHIRELSGGQQQRVFLARALVSHPRLLLLDEPTAGVDIKTRDDMLHLLDELNHAGLTIVLTTHELNAVAAHLPWVVCVNGGIVAEGPPERVFTPEILRRTYKAEMNVISHNGLPLVTEMPHRFGRSDKRDDELEAAARLSHYGDGHHA